MKYFLVLLFLFSGNSVGESTFSLKNEDCPVFKQIISNNPTLDKNKAKVIAKFIKKHAIINKMDAHRAVAIAMQESGYKNIITKKNGKPFDIGMFQINIRTAKEFNINTDKLLNSLEYSVESYFKIMKTKRENCKNLKNDSWVCYHSKTPNLRKKYKNLVNRYYSYDN